MQFRVMIGVLIGSMWEFKDLCKKFNVRRINGIYRLYDGTQILPITRFEDTQGVYFSGFVDKVRWWDLDDCSHKRLSKAKEGATNRSRPFFICSIKCKK